MPHAHFAPKNLLLVRCCYPRFLYLYNSHVSMCQYHSYETLNWGMQTTSLFSAPIDSTCSLVALQICKSANYSSLSLSLSLSLSNKKRWRPVTASFVERNERRTKKSFSRWTAPFWRSFHRSLSVNLTLTQERDILVDWFLFVRSKILSPIRRSLLCILLFFRARLMLQPLHHYSYRCYV